jgi:uncharacterized protein
MTNLNVLTPVHGKEREIFMDVLRGFAILGIFIANLGSGFSWYREEAHLQGPMLVPGWDNKMLFLHHMLIEGKFYSIFSLLFGWGIALQVKRGMANNMDATPVIRRRLAFMLLLGFIHLMIWPGDIVFFYALLGFVLLPLRKFSNKSLLVLGVVLLLSPVFLYWLKMTWPVLNYPAQKLFETGRWIDSNVNHINSEEDFFKFVKNASWWDVLKSDISGFFYRYGYLFFVSRIPKVLGMFLIGYVIGRSDFYRNINAHKRLLYGIIIFGIVVALPANYLLAHYMSTANDDYFNLKTKGLYQTIAYTVGVAPLAMTYVALFILAFQTGPGKKILSFLAPAGKMAFTNYIMQSLIGNFVFLNAGLGLMGQMGPVWYTGLGIIIFALQVFLSTLWLKYFNYGPVEWIWRSATYKKWQPMKKSIALQ